MSFTTNILISLQLELEVFHGNFDPKKHEGKEKYRLYAVGKFSEDAEKMPAALLRGLEFNLNVRGKYLGEGILEFSRNSRNRCHDSEVCETS